MRISDWSSDVCSSDLPNPTGDQSPTSYQWRMLPGLSICLLYQCIVATALVLSRGCIPKPVRAHCCHKGERSEEHTSELQSLMRISYAVFCLKKKIKIKNIHKSKTSYLKIRKNT